MKHYYFKLLMTLLCSMMSNIAFGHDFEAVNNDGVTIYYSIDHSSTDFAVSVSFKGDSDDEFSDEYSGSIIIPEFVFYNDLLYSVTSIGEGAFYDCSNLTSVTIPNSITSIGVCAFQYCI